MSFSASLLNDELWDASRESHHEATESNIQLHYERAKQVYRASGLTVDDILHTTPRFWNFHFDMISTRDVAAFTIATIHLNLCIGTIARYAGHRRDLAEVLNDLQNFDVCGEFMLTEIGHGLDARNLETTATMLPDGSFLLNTPSFRASKSMPPTTPLAGISRVAIVFARLLIGKEDRGVKPFLVRINESERMCPGITSRALPVRPGTKPIDHAITTFDNVRLAPEALLGSPLKPENERQDFLGQIWRVSVGTLALSIAGVSCLKVAGCIAAIYSQRRHVAGRDGLPVPIISFSTQHRPILEALAHGEVLQSYARWTVQEFMNASHSVEVRHGLASTFKALVMRSTRSITQLAERCGWQGLFTYNQISEMASYFQGNSVAEGDTLVLAIRLASEILMGKYRLPEPVDNLGMLSRYEAGLFDEATRKIFSLATTHRGAEFDASILPRCRTMVEAIGQRMAYEAASKNTSVPPEVLDVFLVTCIREDWSWYIEQGVTTRDQLRDNEERAFGKLLPLLPGLLEGSGAQDYLTAPFLREEDMERFILDLPTFTTQAEAPSTKARPRL